jgi:hypothetical protein
MESTAQMSCWAVSATYTAETISFQYLVSQAKSYLALIFFLYYAAAISAPWGKESRENKLIKVSFVAAGVCSSNRHENWPT